MPVNLGLRFSVAALCDEDCILAALAKKFGGKLLSYLQVSLKFSAVLRVVALPISLCQLPSGGMGKVPPLDVSQNELRVILFAAKLLAVALGSGKPYQDLVLSLLVRWPFALAWAGGNQAEPEPGTQVAAGGIGCCL